MRVASLFGDGKVVMGARWQLGLRDRGSSTALRAGLKLSYGASGGDMRLAMDGSLVMVIDG
jgi:hypothetical protein